VSTLPLVPAVVDAVAPVPVVAAGGIGDGRGLAAVVALGAQAGWVGTRFLLAEEAAIHPTYRSLLIEASESDTVHSSLFDVGWENAPHRTLTNSTWRRWREAGSPPAGARPGEGETVAWNESGEPIVRYDFSDPWAGDTGDVEATALHAGQSVGLVREVLPAAEIVARLVEEAEAALRSARGLVD
jgi:NAD(P)H-dependent flavin oxidoreductase YrpB (nitropropane dioxygenase family)